MKTLIEGNVFVVRARIKEAARRAGRDPSSVQLLAATKNRTVEEVAEAIRAGVDLVGENRVQEFLLKAGEVEAARWHFIGHLQRNKVKYLTGRVSLVHSVDSVELAREIGRRSKAGCVNQAVLLQVNVSGEASKHGFAPDAVAEVLREIQGFGGVDVKGLSTMAAHVKDPEAARPAFARLGELSRELDIVSPELSMGMTNDYEVAVQEGATIVRIGTAIFNHV